MTPRINRLEGESANEFRLRRIFILRDGEPSALADLYDEFEPAVADALIAKFAWQKHLEAFRSRLEDAEVKAKALADAGPLDRQPGESAREYLTFLRYARKLALGESMGPVGLSALGEPPEFVRQASAKWRWSERAEAFEAELEHVGLDRFKAAYGAEVAATLDRRARAAALAASEPPKMDQVVDLFRTAASHV